MVNKKTIGIALILIGILLLAVSLLADIVGIGDVDPDHFTFGFKQILGSVVGAVIALVGLFITFKK